MEFRLSLVLLFTWTLTGYCKSLSTTHIPAATNTTNIITTTFTPLSTSVEPRTTTPILPDTTISTTSLPPTTERQSNTLPNCDPSLKKEGIPRKENQLPIFILVGAVSLLVLIVLVLLVFVVMYRKQMRKMKIQNSTTSEGKRQDVMPMTDVDNNHITSQASDSFIEPVQPVKSTGKESLKEPCTETVPKVTVVEPNKEPLAVRLELEPGQRKIDSLKYDQPYAHQKKFQDMMENLMRTESEPESLNDILLREPDYYSMAKQRSSSDTRIGLRSTAASTSKPPPPAYLSMSDNFCDNASSATSEYQVPRNAKKRAGLLQRDPTLIQRPATLKDDNDYLVLMTESPRTQDKKPPKSSVRKGSSKKNSSTLKAIPKDSAQNRIKFFQEKMGMKNSNN